MMLFLMILSKNTDLELVTLGNGAKVAGHTLAGTDLSGEGRAVETDGLNVYAYYASTSGERIRRCTPNGSGFFNSQDSANPLGIVFDVCFDGMYWWALTSTTVYQSTSPFFGSSSRVRSWAHGVTTPRGIFHDGINIGIIGA